MSIDVLQENEDDKDYVIVETDDIPNSKIENPSSESSGPDTDDLQEDARISDADDDDDDDDDESGVSLENASPNRKKRAKRRELQKLAKAATQHELQVLREQNELLMRRLTAVESNSLSQNENALDRQIDETRRDIEDAEQLLAVANETGNASQFILSLNVRDQAKAKIQELENAKRQLVTAKEDHAKQAAAPMPDSRVAAMAKQWIEHNRWYNPNGGDENSVIANQIDRQLTQEGYDPASVDYYVELTSRLNRRIGNNDETQTKITRNAPNGLPVKKAPPIGNAREHAPSSTKKEVYVTPQRKQAMIEAGFWDDPVKRAETIKAFSDYDSQSAR